MCASLAWHVCVPRTRRTLVPEGASVMHNQCLAPECLCACFVFVFVFVCSCVCMIVMVHVAPHATHVSCLVYVFMMHGTCVCQPFSGYIHVPIGVHSYAYHMALGHAVVSRCPVSGESSPVPVPVLLIHVLHPQLFVMHHVHVTHAHCMCVCAMCA